MTFEDKWKNTIRTPSMNLLKDDFRLFWNAAYKAGMLRAAEIAENLPTNDKEGPWFNNDMEFAAVEIAAAIRSEANNEQ